MFIVAFKLTRIKLAAFTLCIAAVVVGLAVILPVGEVEASGSVKLNYSGVNTNDARVAFLGQFGWQVEAQAVEIEEVTIPDEWTDVYLKYNEIQKLQGLDLEKYKGKKVKRWTYMITNYPQESGPAVYANLLIAGGRVIGGDICSADLNGFMHGFNLKS